MLQSKYQTRVSGKNKRSGLRKGRQIFSLRSFLAEELLIMLHCAKRENNII